MRKLWKIGGQLLGMACIVLAMTACGGGGGGGSSSPSLASQAYTGTRTQSTFNLNNAEVLIFGAIEGQAIGGITPLNAESTPADNNLGHAGISPPEIALLARQAAEQAWATLSQVQTSALLNPAEECLNYPAGTLSDTLVESVVANTGRVSGTISYTNCNVGGLFLTGNETVSVTINLQTGDISLAMTFQDLLVDDGVESFNLAGTMDGSFFIDQTHGVPASDLTMNVTVTDTLNKTFWMNNYQLEEWEEPTGIRGIWSGRFYHHDHGFVDFVTDPADSIFIPFDRFSPTFDGKLNFTGATQSRATLWLGVNADDYCINVFGNTGAHLGDLGACSPL